MDYRRRWQQMRMRRSRLRALLAGAALLVVAGGFAVAYLTGRQEALWTYVPPESGPVRFSLSADARTLVAVWESGRLQALDTATGQSLPLSFVNPFPLLSPPLVLADRVIFGADDGTVRCLELSGGRQLWAFRAWGAVRTAPQLTPDRVVVVGSDDGRVYGLQPDTGAWLWSVDCGGRVGSDPAPVGPGRLVVGTVDDGIVGVQYGRQPAAPGGTPGWWAAVAWRQRTTTPVLGPVEADPVAGWALAGTDGGHAYLLQADTGRLLSEVEFPGLLRSRPVMSADRVLVGDSSGLVVAWRPGGEFRWQRRVGSLTAGLAATDSVVYLGTARGRLLALRLADGRRLWRTRLPAPASGGLEVTPDLVVVGLADGRLVAYRRPPQG